MEALSPAKAALPASVLRTLAGERSSRSSGMVRMTGSFMSCSGMRGSGDGRTAPRRPARPGPANPVSPCRAAGGWTPACSICAEGIEGVGVAALCQSGQHGGSLRADGHRQSLDRLDRLARVRRAGQGRDRGLRERGFQRDRDGHPGRQPVPVGGRGSLPPEIALGIETADRFRGRRYRDRPIAGSLI